MASRWWSVVVDCADIAAQSRLGRALYLVSEQLADKSIQQQTVAESLAAEDTAIQNDPAYADAYFYRGVIRAGLHQYAGSQADLQTYIVKAPDGKWTNQAHTLLAQVTTALETPSTTVPPTSTTRKPSTEKK